MKSSTKNITGNIEEMRIFPYSKKEGGVPTGKTGKRCVIKVNGKKFATFDEGVMEFFNEGNQVDIEYTTVIVGENEYNNIKNMAMTVTAPKINQQNLDKIAAVMAATKGKKVYRVTVEELDG